METLETAAPALDSRRNALYIIIGGSVLTGLITGRSLFFNVAYAFVGLMVFAFVWAWSAARWLHMTRRTYPRRAQVGRFVEERFTLRNAGWLPKLWLELYDDSTLPGHHASYVVSSLRREQSWSVKTLCVQRGVFRLGPVRLVTGDPFGLYEIRRSIDAQARLVVLPATIPLPSFELPEGVLPGGDALRRRTHLTTANATGVRDYLPGDGFSRIHWRSTARRSRLMVKEFELDPTADLWIMMDGERRVQAGRVAMHEYMADVASWQGQDAAGISLRLMPLTEEYCVTITASLALHFLRREQAVGFAAYGQRRHIIQVDRGERQLLKILGALAVLQARGKMTLGQLLVLEGDQLARGTTLIIITPSVREDWVSEAARLIRRGINVVAVVIDAESFGGRPGAAHVGELLAANGIARRTVRRGDDIAVALSSKLA